MLRYNYRLQVGIIAILIALFFATIACANEPCSEANVHFDNAFVPADKVEQIDSAIRWVLTNYPGITRCAKVTVWRVALHPDIIAAMNVTLSGYRIEFGDYFMSLPQNDMWTVLLHEFTHVRQIEDREYDERACLRFGANQTCDVECIAAIDEVEATELEVNERYRTRMSGTMMINTLRYLREAKADMRRSCSTTGQD